MAQPDEYNPLTNYTSYAAAHTAAPYNPALLDADLAAISTSINGIIANLAIIQADDGSLQNLLVQAQDLSDSLRTLIPGSAEAANIFVPGDLYTSAKTSITGYLRCNGSLVSRTTYAALFAQIGTTFGVGDGSTTFQLPNIANPVANTFWYIKT